TAPGSQSNTYKPGSSAIKPNPQSQTININPNNNLPLYPGKLKTAAITSPITDITLYPSTNVGDLYTSFRFNGAILDSVNAAIAQGKSLMFGLNVAQNNNSYDITGTIYDLQQNVIASETRTKVTNRAAAGTPNAQNIPVGSPITVPAIFEYYNIGIQQQGSSIPLSFEGLSLSSQVILAASVKSIPLTSPIQSLQVTCPSSDSSVSVIESLSAQNLLDINAYLATNNNLNLMVSLEQNAQGNYDFSCIAYAANGQVVARECRCSVTNHNPNATATSTVPLNAPIPFAAATFTGANVAILLLDTQDLLTIENISLASQITLAPQQISAASVVELPAGVSSVTSMNMIAQFGSLATEPLAFQLNALNSINSALAAGQAVSIQCDVQNGQIMTGAYNFTTSQLIAAAPYAVPAGMTAGDFSGYELQYVLNSQVAGAGTSSTSKTIQCNGSSAVTLAPQVVPVKVQSFYMAGPNGDMSFANNPASLAAINSSPQNVYNKNMPVSIAGGLTAINNIRVLLTDANTTTFLAFDFTKAAGLANI
ncbi:MAG TPA: hypothetical protein VGE32_03420, partial [Cellvibrio sp.]